MYCTYCSILILFKSCIEQGKFLSDWEICSLTPVFKSGDRSLVTNYRPIVKQNNFVKLFDIITFDKSQEIHQRNVTQAF